MQYESWRACKSGSLRRLADWLHRWQEQLYTPVCVTDNVNTCVPVLRKVHVRNAGTPCKRRIMTFDLPAVLWHCWLGHLTRKKTRPRVWWHVKPYSILNCVVAVLRGWRLTCVYLCCMILWVSLNPYMHTELPLMLQAYHGNTNNCCITHTAQLGTLPNTSNKVPDTSCVLQKHTVWHS